MNEQPDIATAFATMNFPPSPTIEGICKTALAEAFTSGTPLPALLNSCAAQFSALATCLGIEETDPRLLSHPVTQAYAMRIGERCGTDWHEAIVNPGEVYRTLRTLAEPPPFDLAIAQRYAPEAYPYDARMRIARHWLILRFRSEPERIAPAVQTMQFDPLNECAMFSFAGIFCGIEKDGHIHS